jgi:hypothetical protein
MLILLVADVIVSDLYEATMSNRAAFRNYLDSKTCVTNDMKDFEFAYLIRLIMVWWWQGCALAMASSFLVLFYRHGPFFGGLF